MWPSLSSRAQGNTYVSGSLSCSELCRACVCVMMAAAAPTAVEGVSTTMWFPLPEVHLAAREGWWEDLRGLLEKNPARVHEIEEGDTPLHLAAINGHVKVTRLLLEYGAQVNVGYTTPLSFACQNAHYKVASLLLSHGADPTAGSGGTSLHCAGCGGSVAIIRLLLKDGRAKVDFQEARSGTTALSWACSNGRVDAARVLLLEGGASYSLAAFDGTTPIDKARNKGHSRCVRLLKWFERELERPYWLTRARAIVDSAEILRQAPVMALATTAEEVQRAREAAAPGYLKARVEGDRELPGVEVAAVAATHTVNSELVLAVTQHVITGMKEDLFLVLLQLMRYTTPEGWAPRAEGQEDEDGGDEMQSEDGGDEEEEESVYDDDEDDDDD